MAALVFLLRAIVTPDFLIFLLVLAAMYFVFGGIVKWVKKLFSPRHESSGTVSVGEMTPEKRKVIARMLWILQTRVDNFSVVQRQRTIGKTNRVISAGVESKRTVDCSV